MAVERVDGVQAAEFSYERAAGFVTFDTTRTAPEAFIAQLERMTDFSATVRPSKEGDPDAPGQAPVSREGGR